MDLIRTFIAINVPPSIQATVEKIQGRFKQIRSPIMWVKPSHLHLTLKFLGNVSEKQIEEIKGCLAIAGQGLNTFLLKATEIGVFPNINYPRVVWLGFSDPTGQLHKLEENIEHHLQKIGFQPEDRKFTPHLTIGRIKSLKGKTDIIRMIHNEKKLPYDNIFVTEIKLMKSNLKPSGPEYSVLYSMELNKTEKLSPSADSKI